MLSDIGIILLNYNSSEDTIQCVESVLLSNNVTYKIYIIDNNSTESEFRKLENKLREINSEKIDLVRLEDNLGFSGGNNIGIKKALQEKKQFIWLLNNDTIVQKDTLFNLLNGMEFKNGTLVTTSKILYEKDRQIIWYAGGGLSLLNVPSHTGYGDIDCKVYSTEKYVSFISGCSMLISAKVFQDIGFLEDKYFMYYEDVDYSIRITKAGYKMKYIPNSRLFHKVGAASGQKGNVTKPIQEYYIIRNRILCMKRNFNGFRYYLSILGTLRLLFTKTIKIMINKNELQIRNKFRFILKGVFDGLKGISGKLNA